MIPMVDHEPRHAAVDADVLSGDEARFFRAEKQDHIRDIHWIPHAACRLLHGVRTLILRICRIWVRIRLIRVKLK